MTAWDEPRLPVTADAVAPGGGPAPFDAAAFRRTLGRFATGVTLVTAADAAGPLGLIVNAFTSVSLEPPLIAVCPSRSRSGGRGCAAAGVRRQRALGRARWVCPPLRPAGRRPLRRHRLRPPRLRRSAHPAAVAFLDCEPVSEQPAGDHWIVVARVTTLLTDDGRAPLVFSDGRLGSFVDLEAQAAMTDARSPRPPRGHPPRHGAAGSGRLGGLVIYPQIPLPAPCTSALVELLLGGMGLTRPTQDLDSALPPPLRRSVRPCRSR